MIGRIFLILAVIVITWLATGQVQLTDPSGLQEKAEVLLPLSVEAPLEQSFIPQRTNLSAVTLQAEVPDNSRPSSLSYYLLTDEAAPKELARGVVPLAKGRHSYTLQFQPQPNSQEAGYILRLQPEETASVSIWASFGDAYSAGTLRQGDQLLEQDLTFKLHYRYTLMLLLADALNILRHQLRLVLALVGLFCLPGLAFLSLLPAPDSASSWLDKLALAVGLSVALQPIILVLVTWVGGGISSVTLWVGLAGCALIISGRLWFWRHQAQFQFTVSGWDIAMLGLLAAGIIITFSAAREVRFPLWTDSYHHAVITQLIIEKGQVPDNYYPYYPIDQFSYHFGFHTAAAFVCQLAGLEASQGVVITGQLLIALTGLTVYLMAGHLLNSRSAAFFAATIVLIFNHVPGFYINWGRYTQLAGQMLLPVFIVAATQALYRRQSNLHWLLTASVLAAGLFLSHYRVIIFGLMFILAFGVVHIQELIQSRESFRLFLKKAIWLGGGTFLLAGLWLFQLSRDFFAERRLIVTEVTTSAYLKAIAQEAVGVGNYFEFSLSELFHQGITRSVFILALLGLIWGWYRGYKIMPVLLLWLLLLIAGAYSYYFGPGLYSLIILTIGLYVPISLPTGLILAEIWEGWLRLWAKFQERIPLRLPVEALSIIGLTVILTFFGLQRMGVALLENGFVRPADEKAMAWITAHTPASVIFLVNSAFWQPTVVEGRDAGWWLPLLAHRETTVPIHRYRDDGSAEFILRTNRLARAVESFKSPEEALPFLKENHIQYIYIGSRPSRLTAQALVEAAGYRLVYHEDGTWIFEVE